jgi:NADH pyrophosphatase NudC (nudix superfamily)
MLERMNNKITDELLDLVSENDTVIRSELRSIIYTQNLKWIRGVNALIINSKGQIWIPRRHPNKKVLPLYLDMSVGGHVQAGESYEQAFARETLEEINLDLNQVRWEKILRLTPPQHGSHAFTYVYAIYLDEAPNFNKDEFIDAQWFYPNELLRIIESGEKAKNDLRVILKNLPKSLVKENHST